MFGPILRQLVSAVPGAIGALFLDYEGETVSMLSERPFELADDDLKMIGAYQGIFLTQLRNLCVRIDAGSPERFRMIFHSKAFFSIDIRDGYYLVLIIEGAPSEAAAWRQLFRCRSQLLAEM